MAKRSSSFILLERERTHNFFCFLLQHKKMAVGTIQTTILLITFIGLTYQSATIACASIVSEHVKSKLNNVLVIISDDLSPFHLDSNHPAKMRHIGRLANRGIKFTNAHSSFPVCGPSRMSFMTGRYAESTKLFTFERYVMQVPGLQTVAQYMAKHHGYETIAFGKVFHEDHAEDCPTARAMLKAGLWTNKQRGGGSGDNECRMNWFCTLHSLNKSGDWRLARSFVGYLKTRKSPSNKPLLAFLGFRKPHMDVAVPNSALKSVRSAFRITKDVLTKSEPPSVNTTGGIIPFRNSLQRFECYFEISRRTMNLQSAYPASRFLESKHSKDLAAIRSHYFAGMAFADENIGYVLDYVRSDPRYADNTAIIYFSDHGFAMGEHGMFCKNALFEQQTRVALVVAPAKNDARFVHGRGRVRTDPVSLVDVFPTVVELGTGQRLGHKARVDNSSLPLDGRSLLHNSPSLYAFSQYPRCADVSTKNNWQCVIATRSCGRIANKYMGFAVRIWGQKYVEWRPFADVHTKCTRPSWPGLTKNIRNLLKRVRQIDPARTGTRWDKLPVQREYFTDYKDNVRFRWGDWEHKNRLVDKNPNTVADAIELSAAIKWRFDPSFSVGSPEQPCSGNGLVKLRNRAAWRDFSRDPKREDVECRCLPGWGGPQCDRKS